MKDLRSKKWVRWIRYKQEHGSHPEPVQVAEQEQHVCMNCHTEFRGLYCPNCGQASSTGRLTLYHAFENLVGIFTNVERGFIHTCIDLIYRPGYMMRDYVGGRRVEYVKPIQLLFFLVTVYLCLHYALYFKGVGDFMGGTQVNLELDGIWEKVVAVVRDLLANNELRMVLEMLLMVLPLKFCFRKNEYGRTLNMVEFFYILIFMQCQQVIFDLFKMPWNRLWGIDSNGLGVDMSVLLMTWNFHQLFKLSWRKALLRAIQVNVYFVLLVGVIAIALIGIAQLLGIVNLK